MMKFILSLLFLAQAVVGLASEQAIQGIVGGAMAFNLLYRHAYASTNGFAAQIVVSDESKGLKSVPIGIEQAGTNLRADFKLTSFTSVPEHFRRLLVQVKLDELTAIYELSSGRSMVVFPQVRAFVVLPPAAENVAGASAIGDVRLQRNLLGSEMVNGVEFRKVRLVEVGDTDGPLVWEQVDQDHFPVLIEIDGKGGRMTLETRSVDLKRPVPKRFSVPGDYTRHADIKSVMTMAAQKAGIPQPAQPPPAQPK
jgi:hypothetical protein